MHTRVCLCTCVGDWSCHELVVEMTAGYTATAIYLPCGTSGMTCNFLTITFKMDSNFVGLRLSGRVGVGATLTDPKTVFRKPASTAGKLCLDSGTETSEESLWGH